MGLRLSEMTTLKCNCSVNSTIVLDLLHFRNRMQFPCFYLVIESRQEVHENCSVRDRSKLQNSRIFCESERQTIFERKVWSACKNRGGEWWETLKNTASFSRLAHHAYGASRLPKTFENDCFAVQFALDFYEVILDETECLINHHLIEAASS